MLTAFSWCQIAWKIRRLYYTSIASSVLTDRASKIRLPLKPPAKRKKIGTGKSKALADAVVEKVDFLCGLVSFNEKERTDMKVENTCIKQEIADIVVESWHEVRDKYINIWSSMFCWQ